MTTSDNIIGSSPIIRDLLTRISRAAHSSANVFITGKSGTGKELCASSVHKQSDQKDGPFIPINCASIPDELMESEIFGHTKGAFTGAISDRKGAISLAEGGTLFLDEIGEMNIRLQAKLLRFLQTGVFQKVGSGKMIKTDIRIICATNRNPLEEIKNKNFREDLYYRLCVIPLHMPSLRRRGHDILELARCFLYKYCAEENKDIKEFSKQAEQTLIEYHWPGNIRQLQNIIRYLVIMEDDKTVTDDMLLQPGCLTTEDMHDVLHETLSQSQQQSHNTADTYTPAPLWKIEKDHIERTITHCNGNITRAAAVLDVSPSTIYRKRMEWNEKSKPKKEDVIQNFTK
jgi:two-component system repressor protein LuxO